jgi:putative endonuclease
MFYVYILYSEKLDKYYVGSTNDLLRRLNDHNRGKTNYSKQGVPWILKYSEEYSRRQEAYSREIEIKKKKSRKYIEYLISNYKA